MSTPKSCPGWEQLKNLSSFECKCPNCGKDMEIFSDEFDKEHSCPKCHMRIDFTKCTQTGSAHSN